MLGVLCCTGIFSLVETRGWCLWTSHCGDFSCCRMLALGTRVSAVVAHGLSSCGSPALEHWLSNCGAQLSCSMGCGILSDQGSNPCLSPALAGRFYTTEPPGKPLILHPLSQGYFKQYWNKCFHTTCVCDGFWNLDMLCIFQLLWCVCVCVNHIYIKISKQLKIRGTSHIVKANFSISVQCQKLYFFVDSLWHSFCHFHCLLAES